MTTTIALPPAESVKTIIETDLTDQQIDDLMIDACLIMQRCPGIVSAPAATQQAIAKWLTAHLISQIEGTGGVVSMSKLGDASDSYKSGDMGTNLNSTRYGQQAILLDPSGCLSKLGLMPVKFEVL